MTYAGIREYWFNGQVYSIKATESVEEPTIEPSGEGWYVQIPADGSTYEITLDNTVVKLSK
jgi:hypothetical protein